MNQQVIILVFILTAGLLCAGCSDRGGQPSHEKKTDIQPAPEQTVNNQEERKTVSQETMAMNSTRDIFLKENPTTGFQWNATITRGLVIETDEYRADPVSPEIVGSGGMHHWIIRGTEKGEQIFDAVYRRSWEPLTGNESRYTLKITVV